MPPLFRGQYSLTRTKRRRLLWCAWWTSAPTAQPFRPPDAWSGGARTEAEAKALAERAAGVPLTEIDGHWAGAWVRVRAGLPAFAESVAPPPRSAFLQDPRALLGVGHAASLVELKAAFRKKALEHHPDRGGDPRMFMAVKAAFDGLVRRGARPRRR